MAERSRVEEEEPRYASHPPRSARSKSLIGPQAKPMHKKNRRSSQVPPVPPRPYDSGKQIMLNWTNSESQSSAGMTSPCFDGSSTAQGSTLPPQLPARARQPGSASLNEEWVKEMQQHREAQQQKLTLLDLAEKHSGSFPLRVKVSEGFSTPQVEISAGDVYNIHFLKKTEVVTIRDSIRNEYTIPLNSAAQFGIVYGQGGHGSMPAVFTTAENVMSADMLPRVVCAMRSYQGRKAKSSVAAGEVLIVKGIHKPQNSGSLLVFSTTTAQEKKLKQECAGCFTTDPQRTKMYLPELLENVQNRLPLVARLYLDPDVDCVEQLPEYLIDKPVTLISKYTEVSLIATSGAERAEDGMLATPRSTGDKKAPKEIISIPVDLNIKVGIVTSTAEADTEELYSDTRNIYQNFDPSKTTLLTDAQEEDVYLTRNQLYAKVRKGHQNEGLDLQMPVMAYQPLVKNTRQRQSGVVYHALEFGSTAEADSSHAYAKPEVVVEKNTDVAAPQQEYSYIEHTRPTRHQVTPFYEDIDNIQARVNSLKEKQRIEQKRIERIKSQLTQASASLSSTNTSIENDIARVKEGIAKISTLTKVNGSSGVQIHNRQMLFKLTEEQVQGLLLLFGLSQYQESFAREFIDGEVLCECTEETLEVELGVSDLEHRAKLMAIISGEYSLRDLMGTICDV